MTSSVKGALLGAVLCVGLVADARPSVVRAREGQRVCTAVEY